MCGHLSLHIPLARSSVTSAPVQTATMNYCIELTRQVSNLFETKSSNRIEMFFGPSLSRDLCHLLPYDGTQSREEEKGFSWFSCLIKFPMPWFRHTPNVYVNFHYSDNRFWFIVSQIVHHLLKMKICSVSLFQNNEKKTFYENKEANSLLKCFRVHASFSN